MPAPARATYTKTCEACGQTYERIRYANGCLQNSTQWNKRRACTPACGNELRKRTYAQRRQQALGNFKHPPCTHCGKPIERQNQESIKRWRRRLTCSAACLAARRGQGGNSAGNIQKEAAAQRKTEREERKKLAPTGYVFDGRFPTPATIGAAWESVTGPDVGSKAATPSRGVRSPRTLAMLRAALRDHPDLGTALAGNHTDAWGTLEFSG